MQNGNLTEHKSASTSSISFGLWASLAFLTIVSSLSADRFRGQVRHEFLENIPVGGAQLEMVDAGDPTQSVTLVTDALGHFETTAFDAGDEVNIIATHPAYARETPTVTLSNTDHFESVLMTPLGNVLTDYHDIIVQISGAVTQLPLRNVPVEITQWDESNTVIATYSIVTDAKGIAIQRGVLTGSYEFKVNDSSLPDADRQPRYEDYSTPLLGRVDISQNHFANVFLKPLKQDLKVRVRGYDFKEKETDVALENVLVEIRGLDPYHLDQEVLHPRSDFTVIFSEDAPPIPGPGDSVDPTVYYIDNGEVVFKDLPPAAYEVKVSRYGYITQRIILEPDAVTGLLPNSYNSPLDVTLPAEGHALHVLLEYDDYVMRSFSPFGSITGGGVTGLGLKVRVVGLEGTNTEGLEYESTTRQNLNSETYAPIGEPMLSGRYRVFVDGIAEEVNSEHDEVFDFFRSIGHSYDVAVSGQTIVEIPAGRTSVSPEFHRFFVDVETPDVAIRGQLVAADTVETDSGRPIFKSVADQLIEIVPNPTEGNQSSPETVTATTDANGYFFARVLPGVYGIRLPGMTDYFGDEVIVTVTNAAREQDANTTEDYEWPLAEAFPDLPSATNLHAFRYFELNGMPIHAAREQFLELRVRRETYTIQSFGSEDSEFDRKVIAIVDENTRIATDYSPTLTNPITLTLNGGAADYDTTIGRTPTGGFFSEPLLGRWTNLPPGDYANTISATIPGHDFVDVGTKAKTFLDWPEPGSAPSAEQAILFDVNSFPNNEFPWEPLVRVPGPNFQITGTPYSPATYRVEKWIDFINENDELDGRYEEQASGSNGFMAESTIAPGYFEGPSLGGTVNAIWTFGFDKDFKSYPVKLTPGATLKLGGPNPSDPTPLPTVTYSLLLEGVATSDHATQINGAKYMMSGSGKELSTGAPLGDVKESPFITKDDSDNFIEQFQTRVRVIDDSASPTLGITVGLQKGMEVNATLQDVSPVGIAGNPANIPAVDVPVTLRSRYGREIKRVISDAEGKVKFTALPGLADYFITVDERGFTPVRRLLPATDATDVTDEGSTSAKHEIMQDLTLLPRPTLINPGVPHNRWGLFLPTVSRSGDVNVEDGINNFDFFAAKDALTTNWKIVADPHQLNVTLPGYAVSDGALADDETLTGPDTIVAAYLIDERRFQKDGFAGGTDPLEDETIFSIPADDEPGSLAKMVAAIRSSTEVQGVQDGSFVSTSLQRRVFVDPADKIAIDPANGRTTITGSFALWDIPPGEFDPVIVLETQRGAYKVYDVPYEGDNANKQLRGPNLPPWFANILDLLGLASGVASTQGRIQEALEDYVPEDNFIPLPDFSMNIEVDKEDDDVDEGYLNYSLTLAMSQEIGQEGKSEGLLGLGPGVVGAETKVEGKLGTNGKDGTIEFTVGGSITAENLIDEAYGTKIAPVGGSSVTFENPTGKVSTTASTNFGTNANTSDPLMFSLSATAGVGATAKVSATLNDYARAIPYAGPVIGVLGDTNLAKVEAFIEGRAAIAQTFTIKTEFPRETKQNSRLRTEAVPQQSFLGETKLELNSKTCIGVGFSTGLELTAALGFAEANIAFEVGGDGCSVSDDISTMELTFNTTNGWPLITNIKGEAKVTADASAGIGPAAIKGKWEFAKAEFEVQFGTDTIVTHFPFTADFLLANDLAIGEGLFVNVGPELVGGLAPAANVNVNGALTETVAFTTVDPSGQAVLQIARRNGDDWMDPIEVPLAPQIGVSDTLTLGDGRTLVVYSVIVDGQDPHDPYADHQVFSRIIEVDGTVGAPINVAYISNPIDQLALAESGSLVELHIKAPATDGTQNFWQMFLTPFDKSNDTWGTTQFRVNETENFDLYLTSGGANGADEILLHWVTQSGNWHWMRTADTDRQTVSGSFNAPPASWATAGFYDHVAATRDGRILRFGQAPFSGGPSERALPLVEGAFATQVAISQQSVTPGGGFLVAWVEKTGHRHELAYLTYGPDGVPVLERQLITNNSVGDYSDLILSQRNADAAFVFARFTQSGFSSLRSFELDLNTGLAGNDDDDDNLMDIAELLIVDADLTDGIELVDHVLDGDDFDGDGATNGEEIRAGSDPANEFSLPAPPEIVMGPSDLTVAVNESAQFSVVAAGENLTYQWRRNGSLIPSATGSTFTIASAQNTDAGIYDVLVGSNGGVAISSGATLTVTGGDNLPSAVIAAMGVTDLANNDLAHLPFRIDGDGPKRLLLRALGPVIGGSVVVSDPYLVLRDRLGMEIDTNEDWENTSDNGAAAQGAASQVGAIPLVSGSTDAALVIELSPGSYTVESGGDGSGLIYVELFDLDESATPLSRLASLGFHSQVPVDGFIPSLGFVVSSPSDRDLVSRYLGPALDRADALLNPSLTLMSGGSPGSLIGANDDWESGNLPALLVDSIRGVRLASGSQDAARIDQLSPGNYLLNAGITSGDQGFGLLELIDPLAQENPGQIAALVPPVDQSVPAGSSVDFNVLAIADSPLSYQWNFNDQPIAGATESTLVLTDVQPMAEGSYSVQLMTTSETVTTAPADLRVLGGGPVRATQSSDVDKIQPAGTATITVEIEWDETPLNLSYQTSLPTGWIMRSHSAASATSAPAADSAGILVWQFAAGASPLSFTFEIEAPADLVGPIALTGAVSHEPTTGTIIESETLPHPLWIGVSPAFHDADTDRDSRLNLPELLRVISLYNTRSGTTRTGRYRVLSGTPDGFDPDTSSDAPSSLSRYHSGDFDRDGSISLPELLRVIELYNTRAGTTRTGAYGVDDDSPDGFTPDP